MLISGEYADMREDALEIIEAGLAAIDPYENIKKLFSVSGNMLSVGNPDFEARNDPQSGAWHIHLDEVDRIFVVGAGKGIALAAKALEEILGDKLCGGHINIKYGDESKLEKIGFTRGAHPVPDENCVAGCEKIAALTKDITARDLVITLAANGVSSLLTLPYPNIPLEDVKTITRILQIERGATTTELNAVRNHVDQLKGGRIARLFHPARMIHVFLTDPNAHDEKPGKDYQYLMTNNLWLHNLPDASTFSDALKVLRDNGAYEACPKSIVDFLKGAAPECETVKLGEYEKMNFRVFGIMPGNTYISAAKQRAQELGYNAKIFARLCNAQAQQAAAVYGAVAIQIAEADEPLQKPAAIISAGEMTVALGGHKGTGGRNQEFALSMAKHISGLKNVVAASVDTDGTDGPAGFIADDAPECLGGGIVDSGTLALSGRLDVDIQEAVSTHNTSKALWSLSSGIHLRQGISLNDLTVILVK